MFLIGDFKPQKKINICVVCLENEADCASIPCCHQILCDSCMEEYVKIFDTCAICRKSLRSISRMKLL